MRHALFDCNVCTASVAILIKDRGFNSDKIKDYYITPTGANPKAFIAFSLWYNENGKCPAKTAKEYLSELCTELVALGIKTLLVADGPYFKFLTKKSKLDFYGYALDSKFDGFEDEFKVILIPNYQALNYNPTIQTKIDQGLSVLKDHVTGAYTDPGKDIINSEYYPESLFDIEAALIDLLKYPELTVDIEGKSLEFWNCGLATISFAWDKHNGLAFAIERGSNSLEVKELLQKFFEQYVGKIVTHNHGFDAKVLVYELWMEHLQDYEGMVQGIKILTKNFDDTKLIAYFALNNAVQNELGLKVLSAPFTGNYAENTSDTLKIDLPDLLRYNLKDTLATWYVKEKYDPIMDQDDQREIYENLFKPSVRTLLQTELCGMPIIPEKVQEAKSKLTKLVNKYKTTIFGSQIIGEFQLTQQEALVKKFTEKAKVKVFTLDDPRITRHIFNPNSGDQVRELLFTYLGLPILDYTKKKKAATGGKVLKKLLNHTKDQKILDLLYAFIGLAGAEKILTSFIPAFENAIQMPDGSWRLYGNFNLGGTQSLRLSSSNP